MMRIAFLARPESGNGFYRGLGPMRALAERGHRVRQLPVERNEVKPVGSLAGVDVLHIHRFCDERVWRIARQAKAEGAAVVWDQDDFQAATPRGVASQRPLRRARRITQWQPTQNRLRPSPPSAA